MVVLFFLVIAQRDRIRAYWWVYRLQNTSVFSEQAFYIACLTGVGDSAADALARLGKDDRAEYRALLIPASQGLSPRHRFHLIRARLGDADFALRISAATALAFLNFDPTRSYLIGQTGQKSPEVATAALAGLARVNTPKAMAAICEAAARNPHPWVRAQAIESLGQQLASDFAAPKSSAPAYGDDDCDPVTILVSALEDSGEFSERLSLEMEIAAVNRALTLKGHPTSEPATPLTDRRTVSQIAATTLTALTGRTFEQEGSLTPNEKKLLVLTLKEGIAQQNPTSRPQGDQ